MKKFIAYAAGISLLACGYHLYKISKNNDKLIVREVKSVVTATPVPTYESTYIIHNTDGTIDFKCDPSYLNEVSPLTTPQTVIVNHNEDGSMNFKIDLSYLDEEPTEKIIETKAIMK